MGFTPPEVTGNVRGVGDFAGLEALVRVRPIPLGFILDIQERQGSDTPADVRAAYRDFGDQVLVSWNVEDQSGNAIPPTGDGLLTQDPALIREVLEGWLRVVTSPSPNSLAASANGDTSGAASEVTARS